VNRVNLEHVANFFSPPVGICIPRIGTVPYRFKLLTLEISFLPHRESAFDRFFDPSVPVVSID